MSVYTLISNWRIQRQYAFNTYAFWVNDSEMENLTKHKELLILGSETMESRCFVRMKFFLVLL